MTKRETILIALVGVAALYAIGDFLYGRLTKPSDTAASATQELTDARKALQDANTSLASLPLKESQMRILNRADVPADDVAIAPLPTPAAPAGGEMLAAGPGSLSYTGFVQVGSRLLAIINGMEYSVGDKLPDSGDVIRAIDGAFVLLYSTAREAEWKLPYSGDEIQPY